LKGFAAIKVALISAAVIFLLAGCGGAPSAEEISQTALQPSGQATQTQTPQAGPPVQPLQLPAAFKTDKTTPKFMLEALEKQLPIVIFIYRENDPLSNMIKENLREAMKMFNPDKVIFLALNSEKPEHVFGMFEPLGVTSVPFIAIIDAKGNIVREYSGYVDVKTLIQGIYDVSGGVLKSEEATESVNTTNTTGE
jgi:hypothetical protein